MTDEEVLIAAKSKPDKVGEREKAVTRNAIILASCICIVLCTLMIILDLWVKKHVDFGKPAILLAFSGTLNVFCGKVTSKMKTLICGIVEAVLALLCLILYLGELFV